MPRHQPGELGDLAGTLWGERAVGARPPDADGGQRVERERAPELLPFERSDLHHCDFRRADLGHAVLRSAKLRGANLKDSDLCSADLHHAQVRGASFFGVRHDESTRGPEGGMLAVRQQKGPHARRERP